MISNQLFNNNKKIQKKKKLEMNYISSKMEIRKKKIIKKYIKK